MDGAAGVANAIDTVERCMAHFEENGNVMSVRRGVDLSAPGEEPGVSDLLDSNVSELLDRFRQGDQAVLTALRGKDGSAVLLKLQDAMNQENRVYTFLSQKLNIEHETQKAIINNIR
jgi:hypothetical protein